MAGSRKHPAGHFSLWHLLATVWQLGTAAHVLTKKPAVTLIALRVFQYSLVIDFMVIRSSMIVCLTDYPTRFL